MRYAAEYQDQWGQRHSVEGRTPKSAARKAAAAAKRAAGEGIPQTGMVCDTQTGEAVGNVRLMVER